MVVVPPCKLPLIHPSSGTALPLVLAFRAAAALAVWGLLRLAVARRPWGRAALRCAGAALLVAALCGVLGYTVLGRTPSGGHQFVWYSYTRGEFLREMFMNALLYVPLGVALAELAGPWSVAAGLSLSLGVESWQYLAGTGLAQGTVVLFNTVGCAVGAMTWLVTELMLHADARRPPVPKEGEGS